MFELGITEIIVIAIVAVLLLGPEQMPKVLYTIGKWARQLSYTRFAVERQFDSFMKREEAKLDIDTKTVIDDKKAERDDGER